MNIKIVTPEYVVFEGEVESVLLPGVSGEFHIMNSHADIVSALTGGKIKLYVKEISDSFSKYFTPEPQNQSIFSFPIKNGVVEFNKNKGIILAE